MHQVQQRQQRQQQPRGGQAETTGHQHQQPRGAADRGHSNESSVGYSHESSVGYSHESSVGYSHKSSSPPLPPSLPLSQPSPLSPPGGGGGALGLWLSDLREGVRGRAGRRLGGPMRRPGQPDAAG